jgi:L-glutamine:2-deoxy-scyllo-inosose/3-amino-2,3-dideoxy-scyllo-inosose aminotransferase
MRLSLENLAYFGGEPIYQLPWPTWPTLGNKAKALKYFDQILSSDRWTVRAETTGFFFTEEVEKQWAEFCQCRYAISVTSGSTAIELALRALEIREGDEVIVPSLGWYATAAAVCRVGATPIFADIDLRTSCIDPQSILKLISPFTKAIIAVHLHCAISDLSRISEISKQNELAFIEDAAQAHGGSYKGYAPGGLSDIACFSFNQEKMIPAGEGGIIVTNSPSLFQKLFILRTDGHLPFSFPEREWNPSGTQGNNYCLSELQAALILSQLEEFFAFNDVRQHHARLLDSALQSIEGVYPLISSEGTDCRPYYEYAFIIEIGCFGDWSLTSIISLLKSELGFKIAQTDMSVPFNPLFGRKDGNQEFAENARLLHSKLLVFHHRYLLSLEITQHLPQALLKIQRICQQEKETQFLKLKQSQDLAFTMKF